MTARLRVEGLSAIDALRQFRQSFKTRMVKGALTKATNQTFVRTMRRLIDRGSGPAVRRDGTPRKRLADSILMKVKRFKDGTGYYSITGASEFMPHAWIYEHGTKLRFRKRIGGKFAYLEPLEPVWTRAFGKSSDERHPRRTTGYMPAAKVALRTFRQEQANVRVLFARFLEETVKRNAGKPGASVD